MTPEPTTAPDSFTGMQRFLRWFLPAATALQVVPCFFLLTLSGYRIVIGSVALFAAAIAGPFELFHQNAVRVPFFLIAGGLSLFNLYLYFYAKKRRDMPSAAWRKQPLSAGEQRVQKIQLGSSILTLLMIFGDMLFHHLHGFGW